jgi:hypothetical protein
VGVARAVTYVGKLAAVHQLGFHLAKLVELIRTSVQHPLATDAVRMDRVVL